jgi:hypothetical protein
MEEVRALYRKEALQRKLLYNQVRYLTHNMWIRVNNWDYKMKLE